MPAVTLVLQKYVRLGDLIVQRKKSLSKEWKGGREWRGKGRVTLTSRKLIIPLLQNEGQENSLVGAAGML
jgi:hypothetical protein